MCVKKFILWNESFIFFEINDYYVYKVAVMVAVMVAVTWIIGKVQFENSICKCYNVKIAFSDLKHFSLYIGGDNK
jgi:hypothetical protein